MPGPINGAALLFLAVYLSAVVYRGNAPALLAALRQEGGALPWLGSVLLVWYIWKYKPLGDLVSEVSGLGLLAAAFVIIPRIKGFS